MKHTFGKLAGTFGLLVGALIMAQGAAAACGSVAKPGIAPSSWQPTASAFRLVHVGLETSGALPDREEEDEHAAIVGFWHVHFYTQDSKGFDNGTEIDAGYSVWHSDGTEIMNSGGRNSLIGNFCLGVWEKVGPRHFQLNHFAAAFDETGTHLLGPANIREDVTVGHRGDRFEGTFTIDQYDEAGNRLAHIQGVIKASRIDLNTPPASIF